MPPKRFVGYEPASSAYPAEKSQSLRHSAAPQRMTSTHGIHAFAGLDANALAPYVAAQQRQQETPSIWMGNGNEIMAYARTTHASFEFVAEPSKPKTTRSPWRRLIDAIVESAGLPADHEIARLLDRSGGRFTDDTEREIERIFFPQTRW